MHINWIIMQAAPDDVIKVSNGIARFEGPGTVRQGSSTSTAVRR